MFCILGETALNYEIRLKYGPFSTNSDQHVKILSPYSIAYISRYCPFKRHLSLTYQRCGSASF
jgi:hypothetical protein